MEAIIKECDRNTFVGPMDIKNAERFGMQSIYLRRTVEDAANFGIPAKFLGPNITTPELHTEIARQGQSIRKLKINNTSEDLQATKRACKEISGMRCLRDLRVGVTRAFVLRAFLRCVENHPNLEMFAVVGGTRHVMSKVRIQSKSLKVIDLRNAGKGVWVTRCICPSLERFLCMGAFNGNGVRHYNPDEIYSRRGDWHLSKPGELSAGENRFYGMKVPDTCIVEFD
jgi:hypothetical protein